MKLNKQIKIVLAILGGLIITFILLRKIFSNELIKYYSQFWVSMSPQEAKSNGVFIKDVEVFPDSFTWKEKTINFQNTWIERQSKINYKLFIFKERILLNEFNLVFTLEPQLPHSDAVNLLFVAEDEGAGFSIKGSGADFVFCKNLTEFKRDTMRVSLISNWRDNREKNIRFVIN